MSAGDDDRKPPKPEPTEEEKAAAKKLLEGLKREEAAWDQYWNDRGGSLLSDQAAHDRAVLAQGPPVAGRKAKPAAPGSGSTDQDNVRAVVADLWPDGVGKIKTGQLEGPINVELKRRKLLAVSRYVIARALGRRKP